MKIDLIALIFLSIFTLNEASIQSRNDDLKSFLNGTVTITRMLLQRCFQKSLQESNATRDGKVQILLRIGQCVQEKSLVALDRISQQDVIQLPYGLALVKDVYGRDFKLNHSESKRKQHNWSSMALDKIQQIIQTHNLKIPMHHSEIFEGRRRRRGDKDMASLMLFGVMAMAIIAVPMGFQFLAVLGGKALLLAKLALILTSIQGLKKVATSNVSYGLYDRRWQPAGSDHHSYEGLDVPDQQIDNIYHHIRPRVSHEQND